MPPLRTAPFPPAARVSTALISLLTLPVGMWAGGLAQGGALLILFVIYGGLGSARWRRRSPRRRRVSLWRRQERELHQCVSGAGQTDAFIA